MRTVGQAAMGRDWAVAFPYYINVFCAYGGYFKRLGFLLAGGLRHGDSIALLIRQSERHGRVWMISVDRSVTSEERPIWSRLDGGLHRMHALLWTVQS